MSQETTDQLIDVQRELAFYRSPEFQRWKDGYLLAKARLFRDEAANHHKNDLFSQAGQMRAAVCTLVAVELEFLGSGIQEQLESIEEDLQEQLKP